MSLLLTFCSVMFQGYRTSQVIQWLRLALPLQGVGGLIAGWGTMILHDLRHCQKKKFFFPQTYVCLSFYNLTYFMLTTCCYLFWTCSCLVDNPLIWRLAWFLAFSYSKQCCYSCLSTYLITSLVKFLEV